LIKLTEKFYIVNLREQIGSIAMSLTGSPAFYYGRKSEINVQGDDMILPAVILIEPDQFGFSISPYSGAVKDTYNVFIQFVDQVTMGEDANYRHPVVEAMRTLCAEFILKLSEADIFEDLNTNIPGVLVVDTYDVNVAGIEINLARLTDLSPRPC
jgi:hypothetical protein